MPRVISTETIILPDGLDPVVESMNYNSFALYVRWQNTKGWTVTTMFSNTRLSAKGRKWASHVPHRNRRHYYFDSYEAALDAAKSIVNNYRVGGLTWSEFTQKRAALREREENESESAT